MDEPKIGPNGHKLMMQLAKGGPVHGKFRKMITVLQRGQSGIYEILGSDILELEMERIHDVVRKQRVKDLYRVSEMHISYTKEINERAKEIRKESKIKTFDSLHGR